MALAPAVQVNYVANLPDTPPFDPIFVDDGGDVLSTIENAEVWAAAGVGGDDHPTHTPTIDRQIYIDTNDGSEHFWFNSAWH